MTIDWPDAIERTPASERRPCPNGFRVTRATAFTNVLTELGKYDDVTDVQLDSGGEHQVRNPNKPYADADFDDPGIVVRFTLDGEEMAAGCDRWDNPRDNAQDLYHYLHETRMQAQRGTATAESEYSKLRLPSGDSDGAVVAEPAAADVLGVDPDAGPDEIRAAYREKVIEAHPDHGGSQEELARAESAKEVLTE